MSAHRFAKDWLSAPWKVSDPGNAGTFNLNNQGRAFLSVVSTGAETRTIPAPDVAGQECCTYLDTAGGTVTVTVTGGNGISSFALASAGDMVFLVSISVAGTPKWIFDGSKGAAATITGVQTFSSGIVTNAVGGGGSTVAFTDRITTTDGVASGTAGVVGRLLYSNTAASTAIASTSAETVFDTNYNMPANTLKAGTVVRIKYQGIQTALVGTDTLAYKLYIGGTAGTALVTSAAATGVSNGTICGEAVLICRTAGTTGTFVATAQYKQITAEGTMTVKDQKVASTTINTQAAQLITASATFNTSNANSVRMDVFTVEAY